MQQKNKSSLLHRACKEKSTTEIKKAVKATIAGAIMVMMAPVSYAHACEPDVIFDYSHKGYVMDYQNDPASTFSGKNPFAAIPGSYVRAYTSPGNAENIVKIHGSGCNKRIVAHWHWRNPTRIVMKNTGKLSDEYRQTFDHEMRHVKVFLETPLEYENIIKSELKYSKNHSQDFRAIVLRIREDMKIRNAKIDSKITIMGKKRWGVW